VATREAKKSWKVSEVARLAHVTTRTLHHYDEIGLLVPSQRSASGYRLYAEPDLQRLQQILLFRELGFSLDAIQQLLDAPAFDRRTALRAQRDLLVDQKRKTEAVIRAVEKTMELLERGQAMDTKRLFDGFEHFDHAKYEDEARERWGDTDAYKESMRRTRQYSKADWAKIKAEGEAVTERLADLMKAGRKPEDAEVMAAAEQHRLHIDRWFYPLNHKGHVGLGDLYVSDPRFTEYYETRAAGLAAFAAAAIRANAERAH
jgi:DNA-binding transcriptional MerR regulator